MSGRTQVLLSSGRLPGAGAEVSPGRGNGDRGPRRAAAGAVGLFLDVALPRFGRTGVER